MSGYSGRTAISHNVAVWAAGLPPCQVAARSARSIGSGAHQLSELSRLVNGALGTTTLRRNVQLRLP